MSPILLIVINDIDYFLLHWLVRAKAAKAQGYEVHVAASSLVGDPQLVEREGLIFHPILLSRRGTNMLCESGCLVSIYRLLRKLRPVLVHTITIKPVIYGGIAARLAGIPALVSTIPGLGYMFVDDKKTYWALRKTIRAAYRQALGHKNSMVIFENGDDRAELIRAGIVNYEGSLVIRGAGVDMAVFTPRVEPEGVPLVIMAARMLWDKGVGDFVAAVKLLKSNGIAARFALVGDTDPGSPAAIPQVQLQNWHDNGDVEWWGRQSDMPKVLAQANIVCLPSYYREGIPRILIEAAACGRAIVTTDAPGCRDIVQSGENGLLVPPRDVDQLARALQVLIEDTALRHSMGMRGRARAVAEFEEGKVLKETFAVYSKLLDRAHLSQPDAASDRIER